MRSTRLSDDDTRPWNALGTLMGLLVIGLSTHAFALLPFENDQNLYVSMWEADVVRIFTPEGTELGSITAQGLDGPRAIAFNPLNGDIWIAGEHSHAVYIFDHCTRQKISKLLKSNV